MNGLMNIKEGKDAHFMEYPPTYEISLPPVHPLSRQNSFLIYGT